MRLLLRCVRSDKPVLFGVVPKSDIPLSVRVDVLKSGHDEAPKEAPGASKVGESPRPSSTSYSPNPFAKQLVKRVLNASFCFVLLFAAVAE